MASIICPMSRTEVYENVITFPATKGAGVATITGDVKYPFEQTAFGPIDILLRADLADKITDTLTINLYVSYDEGTTWLLAASYSDLANGGAVPISVIKADAIRVAPRVRLDAIFDGTGALAADHGCGVDLKISETEGVIRREIFTRNAIDQLSNLTNYTSAMYIANTYNILKSLVVSSYCADKSKVTDNVTWKVQSSYDGTNWFDATTAQTDILNGVGTSFTEVPVTTKLGKYIRIAVITDGTGVLAADHGVQFNVVALY